MNEAVSHTVLDSITLDGNSYFDTEIYPDQNTNTEIKWHIKSGTQYIAGARDDNYKYGYVVTDNFYTVRGTVSSAAKVPSVFWENDWLVKQTGTTFTFNSSSINTDAISSFTLTSPFYLGSMSQNKSALTPGVIGTIYYAKIYNGETLVANIVPVKKSDGTLCLYDQQRKMYLYNKGTGTITT